MIEHAQLMANLRSIDQDFEHDENSVGITWLPHFHDMGLVYGLIQPLFNGFPAYILSPESFVRRPGNWLEQSLASEALTVAVQTLPLSFAVTKRQILNLTSAWLLGVPHFVEQKLSEHIHSPASPTCTSDTALEEVLSTQLMD